MAIVKRKTEEEKELRRADADRRREAAAAEKAESDFFKSPAGEARLAFDRGDQVFQYARSVMSQTAIVVAMVGTSNAQRTNDPTVILNSVCHEGWELVTGSFVFVQHGQQSRDKFMSSGQNVAISGQTVGYYLFKRSEANRREVTKPWDAEIVEDA